MTPASRVLAALERIESLADRAGAPAVAAESAEAAARVREQEFVVACVGQFKRGKSTLVGALIEDRALPAGVTPTTAAPIMVRYGRQRSARVLLDDLWRDIPVGDLDAYVSESSPASAGRRARMAELQLPAQILADGLILVDTPGLGSVFADSTEATRSFLPHVDVALAVIGADPPISGDELELISDVAVHSDHLFVVLNKSDRVTPEERREARTFARRMIEQRLGRPVARIYEVSATDQLLGRAEWPDWPTLVGDLRSLAATRRSFLAAQAGTRAVDRLASQLDSALALQQSALTEPIEHTEHRVRALATIVEETRRSIHDLSPLLGAREAELGATFGRRAREFLDAVRADAHHDLSERMQAIHSSFGPSFRKRAMAQAQTVAHGVLDRWRPAAEADARDMYEEAMRRTAETASALCREAAQRASDDSGLIASLPEPAPTFTTESGFRFNEQIVIAQPASPLRFIADVMLIAAGAHRVIAHDAHRFLDWLLELNVGRAESDLIERLRAGRQRLQGTLAGSLALAKSTAETALAHGVRLREERSAGIASAVQQISDARGELAGIRRAVAAEDLAPRPQ